MLLDTGSTFTFIPYEDYVSLVELIHSSEPLCKWKGQHFVCPGESASDQRYPIFNLLVNDSSHSIVFGPK